MHSPGFLWSSLPPQVIRRQSSAAPLVIHLVPLSAYSFETTCEERISLRSIHIFQGRNPHFVSSHPLIYPLLQGANCMLLTSPWELKSNWCCFALCYMLGASGWAARTLIGRRPCDVIAQRGNPRMAMFVTVRLGSVIGLLACIALMPRSVAIRDNVGS